MTNGKSMKKAINSRLRILRVLYHGHSHTEVIVLNLYWVLYLCHRGCLPTGADRYTGMTLGCLYTLLRVDMGWTNTH